MPAAGVPVTVLESHPCRHQARNLTLGGHHALIRVQVADLEENERWLTTELLGDAAIARVDSRITMKVVKQLK